VNVSIVYTQDESEGRREVKARRVGKGKVGLKKRRKVELTDDRAGERDYDCER